MCRGLRWLECPVRCSHAELRSCHCFLCRNRPCEWCELHVAHFCGYKLQRAQPWRDRFCHSRGTSSGACCSECLRRRWGRDIDVGCAFHARWWDTARLQDRDLDQQRFDVDDCDAARRSGGDELWRIGTHQRHELLVQGFDGDLSRHECSRCNRGCDSVRSPRCAAGLGNSRKRFRYACNCSESDHAEPLHRNVRWLSH